MGNEAENLCAILSETAHLLKSLSPTQDLYGYVHVYNSRVCEWPFSFSLRVKVWLCKTISA